MFDPRRTYPLSLDYLSHLPDKERPTFIFRRPTWAEYMRIVELYDQAYASVDKWDQIVLEAVLIGLVDWKQQVDSSTGDEVPFNLEDIRRVLNPDEAFSLVQKRAGMARLNGSAKKNSELQSS